jgi:biopolymer transport protein ExbB
MSNFYDLIAQGGPMMVPLIFMSVITIGRGLERAWFWYQLLSQEDKIVEEVMQAAHHDLQDAAAIAHRAIKLPIGRFLIAPLKLNQPTPETFRLALETAGDKEFFQMRRGDKLLESVIGLAPLFGLLGTVTGLILTFSNLNIGSENVNLGQAAAGIGEALTTTAGGMIVAILALSIFRVLVTLQAQQEEYFSIVGGELELIYRQIWYEPLFHENTIVSNNKREQPAFSQSSNYAE